MSEQRSTAVGCLLVFFSGLLAFHWFVLGYFGLAGTFAGIVSSGEEDVAFRTHSFSFLFMSFPLFASAVVLLFMAALLPLRRKLLWLALCIPPSVVVALLRWYNVTHYPMWD